MKWSSRCSIKLLVFFFLSSDSGRWFTGLNPATNPLFFETVSILKSITWHENLVNLSRLLCHAVTNNPILTTSLTFRIYYLFGCVLFLWYGDEISGRKFTKAVYTPFSLNGYKGKPTDPGSQFTKKVAAWNWTGLTFEHTSYTIPVNQNGKQTGYWNALRGIPLAYFEGNYI
jgi:hypothetical protein